jgi:hypothetical protein
LASLFLGPVIFDHAHQPRARTAMMRALPQAQIGPTNKKLIDRVKADVEKKTRSGRVRPNAY